MTSATLARILSAVNVIYRATLCVYPAAYRREYGPLMAQLFQDLCRDAVKKNGSLGLMQLGIRTLVDIVTTATVEHLDQLKNGGLLKMEGHFTKRQRCLALVFAGFPLGLGLVLSLLNPRYMGRMVLSTYPPAQPLGWAMTAAVLVLAGMAYLTQRAGLALASRRGSTGQLAHGTALQRALFVSSVVLFVLPATFLVLFGPAVLTLVEAGVLASPF